ncbi:MAG TPA: peptidoglycan recognition family protein [Candidatus Saccharimonadales bacterium]|nr:peptidoglycan recognition family protein [Candidatus Saccharimonadales bacterium]
MQDFDAAVWDALVQDSLWYMSDLYKDYLNLIENPESPTEQTHALKLTVRRYFAEQLRHGKVALGQTGQDFDAERQAIDTVVIHHTAGSASNYTLDYLNAVQLLRIYAASYRDTPERRGRPIWSGHFRGDQQVFWGYHWFIFEDGRAERILPDDAIGWHSGNWDMNTRSIGICLAGNFMQQPPNAKMLEAAQLIIREHYADPSIRIIGHREVPRDTTCPGDTFSAWRAALRS